MHTTTTSTARNWLPALHDDGSSSQPPPAASTNPDAQSEHSDRPEPAAKTGKANTNAKRLSVKGRQEGGGAHGGGW